MPGRQREDNAQDDTSNKRARISRTAGVITKIKVHNFMTYMDAEIVPGARLNLVLGPNGTGKSSLVNAICLGLAGNTSLLGRADNVRDFVRRGESSGFVQIWLTTGKTPNDIVNIRRTLDARENSSEWRINGETKNMRDVKALVKSLNVQLDNLCQFLPQDKVVEFAKLKPVELLLETEKAVGDSSLHGKHEALIEHRKELLRLEQVTTASEAELALQERANEGLSRDVERFEKKVEVEKEVAGLTDKLYWTKYNEFKRRQDDSGERLQQSREQLDAKREELDALTKPKKAKENKHVKQEEEFKNKKKQMSKVEKESEVLNARIEELSQEGESKQEYLETLEQKHEQNQATIAQLEQELARLKEEAEEVQVEQSQTQAPDHSAELKKLQLEKRDASVTKRGYESQRDRIRQELDQIGSENVAIMEQLRRLSSVKVQRLKLLEMHNRGITALTNWLDQPENKERFKGRVYGPIGCEVTVDTALNAQYLEQHCPRDLWARFVTEFPEDQRLLGQLSQQQFKYRPVITNYGGNVQEVIRHRLGEASTFAQYHIANTLDEGFTAPATVKLAMCQESNLAETYVGTAATNAEEFLERHRNIQRLLTPDSTYVVRTSKYNQGARSMNVAALRPPSLLGTGDDTQLEAEKRQLKERQNEYRQRIGELEQEQRDVDQEIHEEQQRMEAIDAQIKKLTDETNALKNKRSRLLSGIKTKEKGLTILRNKPDPREEAPAVHAEISKLNKQMCKEIDKLVDLYAQLLQLSRDVTVAICSYKELEAQIKNMARESRQQGAEVQHFERLVQQLEECIAQEAEKFGDLKKAAVDRTGRMTSELKQRFAAIGPRGVQELEEAINEKQDEMDNIQMANPRAMEEYKERQRNIARNKDELAAQKENLDFKKAEVEQLKEEWLPELQGVVREINKDFGSSFKKIGCSGEVELHQAVDQQTGLDDYAQYAIHIKVKFRAEEDLQLLTAHRQSGGERSVSTILYLIAIQHVTKCPFRVVDEINQGMDPVNERKVFTQLVEAACQPGTPQCFLLTPKLLPNLPYSEHVKLLEIYNGTLVTKVANGFQKEQIVGGRLPLAAAA